MRLGRILAVLVAVAVLGAATATVLGVQRYLAPGPLAADKTLVLPRGEGTVELARRLTGAGVLREPYTFAIGARVTAGAGPLKAGEYLFKAGISPAGVAALLRSGRTVVHHLTVPEGLTSAEIVSLVRAAPELTGTVGKVPPEGTLMPATYDYSYGDSRARLIARMRADMAALVKTLWAGRAKDLTGIETPEQAVTLASLVEKETALPGERPLIAGVFLNRIARGMKLQSDPTVAYAVTGGKAPLDRPLTRDDLRTESPYNTYVVTGLPPGPIANPGKASLEAALHPDQTDYLYFVADGQGGHVFARTLADHNRNVAHWRAEQKGAAPAAADPIDPPPAKPAAPMKKSH